MKKTKSQTEKSYEVYGPKDVSVPEVMQDPAPPDMENPSEILPEEDEPDYFTQEAFPDKMKVSEELLLYKQLTEFKKLSKIESWDISICVNDNIEALERSLAGVFKYEKHLMDALKSFEAEKQLLGKKHATVKGQVQTDVDAKGNAVYKFADPKAYSLDLVKLMDRYKTVIDGFNAKWKKHIENCSKKDSTYKIIYLSREVAKAEAPKISTELQSLIHGIIEPLKK